MMNVSNLFFLLGNTRYKKSETPFGLNTNKFHIYSVNASCLSPQFDSKAVTLWKAQPQNVTLICSVWDIFCDNCSIYPIFPPRAVDFSSPRTKINFIRIPRTLKKNWRIMNIKKRKTRDRIKPSIKFYP